MPSTTAKPRGRRPGREDTRGLIQSAALRLFSRQGYDKVSLRAIAREADVDPALIHHYFESKADLFSRSVLDMEIDAEALVRQLVEGPRETVGERGIKRFLEIWGAPGGRERFSAMMRAAVTEDSSQRPLSEFMTREVLARVAEAMGHSNARLRGQLAVSAVLGLTLSAYIFNLDALASASDDELALRIGRALQHYLVEDW